jgi:hypothetical protein
LLINFVLFAALNKKNCLPSLSFLLFSFRYGFRFLEIIDQFFLFSVAGLNSPCANWIGVINSVVERRPASQIGFDRRCHHRNRSLHFRSGRSQLCNGSGGGIAGDAVALPRADRPRHLRARACPSQPHRRRTILVFN